MGNCLSQKKKEIPCTLKQCTVVQKEIPKPKHENSRCIQCVILADIEKYRQNQFHFKEYKKLRNFLKSSLKDKQQVRISILDNYGDDEDDDGKSEQNKNQETIENVSKMKSSEDQIVKHEEDQLIIENQQQQEQEAIMIDSSEKQIIISDNDYKKEQNKQNERINSIQIISEKIKQQEEEIQEIIGAENKIKSSESEKQIIKNYEKELIIENQEEQQEEVIMINSSEKELHNADKQIKENECQDEDISIHKQVSSQNINNENYDNEKFIKDEKLQIAEIAKIIKTFGKNIIGLRFSMVLCGNLSFDLFKSLLEATTICENLYCIDFQIGFTNVSLKTKQCQFRWKQVNIRYVVRIDLQKHLRKTFQSSKIPFISEYYISQFFQILKVGCKEISDTSLSFIVPHLYKQSYLQSLYIAISNFLSQILLKYFQVRTRCKSKQSERDFQEFIDHSKTLHYFKLDSDSLKVDKPSDQEWKDKSYQATCRNILQYEREPQLNKNKKVLQNQQ